MASGAPVPERLTTALSERYRVERELGAGGMATVFLAQDLKHDRQVAIKVLHEDLGFALGAERFLAEIRTTARLQHPHILPLLDSGSTAAPGEPGGLLYYVMPYVAGESLRDRLTREKQLPIEHALRITREVADALGHAHAQGIVHRDIKPENVLLQGGHALVADFGIALAVQSAGGARLTQTGLSLGTPQYMSPEQAMGERTVDARSDVYALGAVLYEMLTGEPPFTGATVAAVVAKVLGTEPAPPTSVRKTVPAHVEAAVLRALAKLPADRWGSAEELTRALDGSGPTPAATPTSGPSEKGGDSPVRRNWRERAALPLFAFSILLSVLVALDAIDRFTSSDALLPAAFTIDLPEGYKLLEGDPAVSPDGRLVAFVADSSGVSRILIRDLAQPMARAIPGTDGAGADPTPPFFSPDGRWLAFIAGRTIRKVQIGGEDPSIVDVADFGGVETVHGGTWTDDGWLILGAGISRGLVRVREAGGALETLAEPDRTRGEISYRRPEALPATGGVLFTLQTLDGWGVAHLPTHEPGVPRVLIKGALGSRYLPSGHLVYCQGDGLFLTRFKASGLEVRGSPTLVMSHLPMMDWGGGLYPLYAVSPGGTLAIVTQPAAETRAVSRWTQRLVTLDRDGNITLVAEGTGGTVRFSPTGEALVTYDSVQITTHDLIRDGLTNRLTFGAPRVFPICTPDGSHIVYTSYESGAGDLYSMSARDGSGARLVLTSERRKYAEAITPDGRYLLYREYSPETVDDIWMLPLEEGGSPTPLIRTESREYGAAVSPDGGLLAFTTNRTGRPEVYVQGFGEGVSSERVSIEGGSNARWHPDGTELFFLQGGRIMSVSISMESGRLRFGTPRAILPIRVTDFDVAPDGKRFAALLPAETAPERFLTVFVNWRPQASMLTGNRRP